MYEYIKKKERLSLNTLWVFECNDLWQNHHINGHHINSKEQQQTSATYGIYQPVCMWTQQQRPQLPIVSTKQCACEHSHRDLSCLWYLPTGEHVNTATETSAAYGIYQPVSMWTLPQTSAAYSIYQLESMWTQPQRLQLPMVSTNGVHVNTATKTSATYGIYRVRTEKSFQNSQTLHKPWQHGMEKQHAGTQLFHTSSKGVQPLL